MRVLSRRFHVAVWVSVLMTMLAACGWGARPSVRRALASFWLADLPPLHGLARIYIYAALLVTALLSHYARPHLGDSPLQAPELYAYTLPRFFSLEGFMQLLHARAWLHDRTLRIMRGVTVASFILCIIGAGGQLPPILVGVGMLLLHGVVQGCIGTSHRWYVPVYTCLALAFANGNADLSVDAWMTQQLGDKYPFAPVCSSSAARVDPSLLCSGFARKLVLLAGISTLFFGAITKFINGGFLWLDGKSLSYYVSSEENGRSALLKNLMHRHRWISLALSLASIGLEAGSIVAVFVPQSRAIMLASAAGMHLGIWLTMWPNYFPQTVCYALGMAWPGERPAGPLHAFLDSANPALWWAEWFGVWVCVFLTLVAVLRIEFWPLTGIPMYSFYRDSTYSYKHLRDAAQAQLVALEHAASGYPNAIAWSNLWINLRLKNTDPAVTEERRKRKAEEAAAAAAAAAAAGKSPEPAASPDSPVDPDAAFAHAADVSAASSSSSTACADRKSAESSGLLSSEREFVNLKSRVTESTYTRSGRSGVYVKQWRRTLHNVAAADMAAKPLGHIEDSDPVNMEETAGGRVYPGLRWLQSMLPHLRAYARENAWSLPAWADSTGELQLRARLKDRYAILARTPWNNTRRHAKQPRTTPATADEEDEHTAADEHDGDSASAAAAAAAPSRRSRKSDVRGRGSGAADAAITISTKAEEDAPSRAPTTPRGKRSTSRKKSPRRSAKKK